ncbi:hypothetical protein AAEX28_12105 [Lentisphaerota bacterium WC36G]|nr:hypothetical protein LJT99_14935 [Lentisphaerae bacterium WC36]
MFKKLIILTLIMKFSLLTFSCSSENNLLQKFSDEKRTYSIADVRKALQQGALKEYFPKVKNFNKQCIEEKKNINIPYQVFDFEIGDKDGSFLIYKNKLILLYYFSLVGTTNNFMIKYYNNKNTLFYTYNFGSGIEGYVFCKYVFGEDKAHDINPNNLPAEFDGWATYERKHMNRNYYNPVNSK